MTAAAVARRRYVDVPYGQIHVAEAGHGPALLCLHQTPRSGDEFREMADLLAGDLHVVAIDLPGMGASDPLPGAASIEGYAEAALAVADALTLERFHVCGHHTGGVVAVELAARAPERVVSLVLSSTPWVDEAARRARRAAPPPVDVATHDAGGVHLAELWQQRSRYYPPGHALLDRYMIDALRARDSAEGHVAVGNYEMETRAPLVRCPVLVVEHAADPFATRHTDALRDRFRPAAVVSIEGGSIALEHSAAQVARAVGDFIRG